MYNKERHLNEVRGPWGQLRYVQIPRLICEINLFAKRAHLLSDFKLLKCGFSSEIAYLPVTDLDCF